MKKVIFCLCLIFNFFFAFSQQPETSDSSYPINETGYKISATEYSITESGFKFLGKTSKAALFRNYPLDKKRIFKNEDELSQYLEKYKKELINSRHFQSVDISYESVIGSNKSASPSDNYDKNITDIIVKIALHDSLHLLAIPYGKYNSNSGLSFKIKVKDTNFLGTMNPLNAEIALKHSSKGLEPVAGFSYDFPFTIGKISAAWLNNYGISYTIGNKTPEWNLKTGLKFLFPYENISFVCEAYQYFFKNYDYQKFNDDTYFKEEAIFSMPIILAKFENLSKLYYIPYISFDYNWDFDGISKGNSDISSPAVTIGQKIYSAKVNWNDNFRTGYDIVFKNSYTYNFQRNDFSPYISLEAKFYANTQLFDTPVLNIYGFSLDFYAFHYFYNSGNTYSYGEKIGPRLRGILDEQNDINYGNLTDPMAPKYSTSTAVVVNFDFPFHLFTTDFKYQLINFSCQLSPFFDAALIYNRETSEMLSIKEGLYAAGLEVLVYPLKWSSYTIRASIGFDIKKILKSDEDKLSALFHNNEVFIGIGLFY